MLRPLGALVGRWTPAKTGPVSKARSAARGQPLGDVLSVWTGIVGEEVAQHAMPIERSSDALVVLVTSSAWSNQLSLLAGHILCALTEAGIEGVERLRFRVGRPRRAPVLQKRESSNGQRPKAHQPRDESPSATLAEAVLRLRGSLVLQRNAKRAEGWNGCVACGALLPKGDRCAPCVTAELTQRSGRVQRLMFDVPWLGYSGTAEVVERLGREEYEANRTALLARWWEALEKVRKTGKVSSDGRERQIASSYLLLKTLWEPERVTPVIARNELGQELYNLLFEEHHNK